MDISLLEFIVYGIIGYTGAVMLVVSAFRETPDGKAQSIVRAMYLTLSMISIMILSGSGLNITTETPAVTQQLEYNVTSGVLIGNVTTVSTAPATFVLINPIWVTFHYMLAVVMLVYIILQILILFTKI